MRTIVINTFMELTNCEDLFFLPFSREDLVWIPCAPERSEECVKELSRFLGQRNTRQSYRMVILTDLSAFPRSESRHIREGLKKLMRAFWNARLLEPLARNNVEMPQYVLEVFLYSGEEDRHSGIAEKDVLHRVFGLQDAEYPIRQLLLRGSSGGASICADFTELFSEILRSLESQYQENQQALQTAAEAEPDGEELDHIRLLHGKDYTPRPERNLEQVRKDGLELLRKEIDKRIPSLQDFEYVLPGNQGKRQIPIYDLPFPMNDWTPEHKRVDLQINLSRCLLELEEGKKPESVALKPHSTQELEELLSRAENRLEQARRSRLGKSQTYYSLTHEGPLLHLAEVRPEIENELKSQAGSLPCVADAFPGPVSAQQRGSRFDTAWFRVGLQIRRFEEQYALFRQQYEAETVRREQETVLTICANAYHSWRDGQMERDLTQSASPQETRRPKLREKNARKTLSDRQGSYLRGSMDCLTDYEDKRKEAHEIAEGFRNCTDFRSAGGGMGQFRRFTLLMGAIFILLMLFPYVMVEWGQVDVALPQYLWFLILLVVMAVLYGVGVLFWLRQLSGEIHEYSTRLGLVIEESRQRRVESVHRVVELYGSVLPACMEEHELQRLQTVLDEKNEVRERHFNHHVSLIDTSIQELQEVRSALAMGQAPMPEEPVEEPAEIDYNMAPWEGVNRRFYGFFRD